MIERVKKSAVIHTDETTVPVQDDQVKGQCKKGRIWTYLGDRDNPYVVYDYTPDRTRAGLVRHPVRGAPVDRLEGDRTAP